MNNLNIFRPANPLDDPTPSYVGVNEDLADYSFSEALTVWSTLAVNSLPSSYVIFTDTITADKLIVSSLVYGYHSTLNNPLSTSIQVLSGNLSTESGKFFQGESELYDNRFNIIQPSLSTLQFNSTLFVNHETNSVGINTSPNFTLDVESLGMNTTTYTYTSTLTAGVFLSPFPSTLTYAFLNSNTTPKNVLFSENDSNWIPMNSLFKQVNSNETYTYSSYFTVGINNVLTTNTNDSMGSLQEAGSILQYFLGALDYSGPDIPGFDDTYAFISRVKSVGYRYQSFSRYWTGPDEPPPGPYVPENIFGRPAPSVFNTMAYDGKVYVVGGTYSYNKQAFYTALGTTNPLYRSEDGIEFASIYSYSLQSNLFPYFYPDNPQIPSGCYSLIYGGFRAPVWIAAGAGKSSSPSGGQLASLYRSTDSIVWQSAYVKSDSNFQPPVGQYVLRSVVAVPYENETMFLAGGTTYLSAGGFVQTLLVSYDLGVEWQYIPSPFSGTITGMATNGSVVVAAVEYPVSLLYSPVNRFYFNGWIQGQGDVFTLRANSVIWNGSVFVAAGDSGIRHSLDGITWYNPGGYSSEVLNLAYTSNLGTNMVNGVLSSDPLNILLLQNSPSIPIQGLLSTAMISYYPSTILNLNNALVFDSNQNVIVPGTYNQVSPLGLSPYRSSFVSHSSYISTFVSTNRIVVGSYILGVQSV